MSTTAIQKQLDAIQRITAEALKTPESARKLLAEIGIIKVESKKPQKQKK